VLALDLADQRLHPLHLLLRADLPDEERREDGPDDDREEDDREREVDDWELVDRDEEVEEREEEDVPRRVEMLDAQEALAHDDRHQDRSTLSANRVIATWVEWVAATDSLGAHPRAAHEPVFLDRLVGVDRA